MSARNSNALIQKLLEAEQEAETMIRRAKENRAKKLKEAQASAEVEIQKFKAVEDARFSKEYDAKYAEDDKVNELEETTKEEIENVKKDYRNNRDPVIGYLIQKCVEVDLSLSEKDRRQVALRFAPEEQR